MSKCSLVLQVLALAAVASAADNKMQLPNVTVYYESHCEDSVKFITQQFTPVFRKLYKSFNVEFIPFGKSSTIDDGRNWTCQHGSNECLVNKYQACGLNDLKTKNPDHAEEAQVTFVDCVMGKSKGPEFPPKGCASDASHKNYTECANNDEGREFYKINMKKTMDFQSPLKSVPTIVFNNKYSEEDNMKAQTNFKEVLCKYLNDPKSAECSTVGGSLSTTASVMTILVTFSAFVLAH